MLAILILAAGRSSRMRGADKLLQEVEGKPLLRVMAERALGTGCAVIVALPPQGSARHAALEGLKVTTVDIADAALGMAHSLAGGFAAIPKNAEGVMIVPADMPEITQNDLTKMRDAWAEAPEGSIIRATSHDGKPGHPVIFPKEDFNSLGSLTGDEGARSVLVARKDAIRLVALPENHALTDLDTPEDWQDWRQSR